MASNVLAGRIGNIMYAATSSASPANLGALRNFEVTADRDMMDAGSFDSSGYSEHLPGEITWQMTAETLFLSTGATSQQDELRGLLASGSSGYFRFYANSTSGHAVLGWGYVAGFNFTGDRANPQLQNFTIQGDGAYTLS